MNWSNVWESMFGTTTWLGIDIGFWISMGISILVAILMVIVFWSLKPKKDKNKAKEADTEIKNIDEVD